MVSLRIRKCICILYYNAGVYLKRLCMFRFLVIHNINSDLMFTEPRTPP